jgi:hypothetical protein
MKKLSSIIGIKPLACSQIYGQLNRLAAGLRGRNRGVFLLELLFGLWLAAAKIQALQHQPKASGKKPSPVAGLLKKLARDYPTLPKRRALDGWVEGLMAALSARQVISRPQGATGPKSRTEQLRDLQSVTLSDLRKIVLEYESMNNLRAELLGKTEPAASGSAAAGEPAGDLAGRPDPIEAALEYLQALAGQPSLTAEDIARVQAIAAKAALVLARGKAHPSGASLSDRS